MMLDDMDTEFHNPPECAGTFLSMTWEPPGATTSGGSNNTVVKTHPNKVMREIRFYCESPAMVEFCERAGLHGCAFQWNQAAIGPAAKRYEKHHQKLVQQLKQTKTTTSTTTTKTKRHLLDKLLHPRHGDFYQLYQRFWNAYETSDMTMSDSDRCDSHDNDSGVHSLGVVFHGTPQDRVAHILEHGLDPKYRRTQAFGKGEYFSKDPGLATTYCQGGSQLIVYLVFIPEDCEKYYSQRDRDILVIDNIAHELPIGVLSFQRVDTNVVQHTQQLRIEQKALKEAAIAQENILKAALAQDEQPSAETLHHMDQQVRAAWRDYYRTKLDENRNTLQHLTTNQTQDTHDTKTTAMTMTTMVTKKTSNRTDGTAADTV